MTLLNVITRDGESRSLPAAAGLSVMEILRDGGVADILALCGGCCACATCHVYVDQAFLAVLPPLSPDEDALLEDSGHRRPQSRLACQLPFDPALDGLTVIVAPEN